MRILVVDVDPDIAEAVFGTVAPGFDPIANERGGGYRLNLVHER